MSTVKSYITGYVLSILLTLAAFGMMELHTQTQHAFPTHSALAVGFITLALAQLLVQLYFFLHMGRGQNKHWNAVALGFALFIVAVVVGGTLWIMQNLQHNQMQNNFINGQVDAQHGND